jgi:phosphatidylglycerophosphatase A
MTTATDTFRPTWLFVIRHPAHFIAFGGGIGLIRRAPGTFGTLAAFPLFWLLQRHLLPYQFLLALALMFLIGIWASDWTGRMLRVPDHKGIVWDEIVAFLLVLFFTPAEVPWQVFAFLLFRAFDIAKPPPIGYFDAHYKNGLGVMLDDLIAALYTLLVIAAWVALFG